jgi:predicted RNase H-like HicB family nuclease
VSSSGSQAIIFMVSVQLTIVMEKGEDGFWVATIPEVTGAFSQGKTNAGARRNVISAME